MWNIDCQLEKELVFPVNYADIIAQARDTVKNAYGALWARLEDMYVG